MKRNNWVILLIVMVMLGACQNKEEMTTIIYPDGSCEKVFCSDVNEAFMQGERNGQNNPFPVEVDSLWNVTILDTLSPTTDTSSLSITGENEKKKNEDTLSEKIRKNNTRTMRYKVKIHRKFSSVEQMNKEFRRKKDDAWHTMPNQARLQQKFRWFYTYYVFQEKYNKVEYPFPLLKEGAPTKEELDFLCYGEGDLLKGMNGLEIREYVNDLASKYELWTAESYWKAIFSELLQHCDEEKFYPLSKKQIADYGKMVLDSVKRNTGDDFLAPLLFIDLNKRLNNHFHTDKFNVLWEGDDAPMTRFQESVAESDYYRYSTKRLFYRLQMPGTLVRSNGVKTDNHTLYWQVNIHRMERGDYVLEAVSRRANIWAFIITGLVILAAFGGYVFGKKKH